MILDTCFLIQIEREITKLVSGTATKAMETFLSNKVLYITDTIAGELASGESLSERARWETFIRPYPILKSDKETAWNYGQIVRHLRKEGNLIGSNDLWIAAAALSHKMPLVTRNIREFERIPGLVVLPF